MATSEPLNWRRIAELVGLAGIIGSLVFVGMQLQQDRELARVADYNGFSEVNIGLAGLIAENRDVWIHGLDGDELSLSDQMVFENIARILYRRQMLASFRTRVLRGRGTQEVIDQYAFYMYLYPGLKSAFEKHAEHSRLRNAAFGREEAGFRTRIRSTLIDLETRSPALPPRDYVFF